jgi:hypothetical protein
MLIVRQQVKCIHHPHPWVMDYWTTNGAHTMSNISTQWAAPTGKTSHSFHVGRVSFFDYSGTSTRVILTSGRVNVVCYEGDAGLMSGFVYYWGEAGLVLVCCFMRETLEWSLFGVLFRRCLIEVGLVFYEGDVGSVSNWCFMRETLEWTLFGVLFRRRLIEVGLVFYEGDVGLVSDWYFMRETLDWCQFGV